MCISSHAMRQTTRASHTAYCGQGTGTLQDPVMEQNGVEPWERCFDGDTRIQSYQQHAVDNRLWRVVHYGLQPAKWQGPGSTQGGHSLPPCFPDARYGAWGPEISSSGSSSALRCCLLPWWISFHHWTLEVWIFDTFKDSHLSLCRVLDGPLSLDVWTILK
jgi:hypothetical protein